MKGCDIYLTFISIAEEEAAQQESVMEPREDREGRSFVEVINEKYSPENFPYRRGPGMGVVVVPTAGLQGSPMKGEMERSPLSCKQYIYFISAKRGVLLFIGTKFYPVIKIIKVLVHSCTMTV